MDRSNGQRVAGGGSPIEYSRGRWLRRGVLGGGLILAGLLFAFDGVIGGTLERLGGGLGGDLRRELEVIGQFGAAGSVVLVCVLVWLLDEPRRRRLVDLIAASAGSWLVVVLVKLGIGRARPKFEDASAVLGPWRTHAAGEGEAGVYAWQFWKDGASELWSMPSGHTAAAAAMGVWLAVTYPALRWLMVVLVVLVGASRVVFGAHYLSDVVVGAGIGFAVGHAVVSGWFGVRGLDWVWKRVVDRGAAAAFDEAYAYERERGGERWA